MRPHAKAGFSLIEMLIVIAVLGVLLAIAADRMAGLRAQLKLDRATQMLVQDLQVCRSRSLAQSRVCRLVFVDNRHYRLDQGKKGYSSPKGYGNFCNDTRFKTVRSRSLPQGVQFTNVAANDCVAFDTRGFAHYGAATPGQFKVSDGKRQRKVIPSLVGAIKVVP